MNIRLIVNADDYGRTPGVSRGIRKAHLEGIVTSTTALMNMPGVEDALHQAMQKCPKLGLGVHLVATSGKPVLPAAQVSTLTGGEEYFHKMQIARLDQIDPDELCHEWQAQVRRFVQVTGQAPDHLDSHHHFAFFSETICRIMLELAGDYDCAVRCTLPARRPGETGGLPRHIYDKANVYVPALMQDFGTRHPDHFEGTFYDETGTVEHLTGILNELPEGCSELMCHPGYADAPLLGEQGSTYNKPRENEIATLTDQRVVKLIAQRGIKQISFREL